MSSEVRACVRACVHKKEMGPLLNSTGLCLDPLVL